MAQSGNNKRPPGAYPEGEAFNRFVRRRQRVGKTWHGLFFAATMVGIIALAALLIDVINDAFGYVAIQSNIPETTLVALAVLVGSYYGFRKPRGA